MIGSSPAESVMEIDSPGAVESLLSLVNAQEPILDTTYGSGVFWRDSNRIVHGYDKDPARGVKGIADFTALGFPDGFYQTVVFDPPFHPFVNSAEEDRFSGLGKNEKELKSLFQLGCRECWRVTSRHLVVKCQSYIHNHMPQWMPLWAIEVCGEPFEWLIATRAGKRVSGRWVNVKSLRRKHADYLVFDKRGNKR